MKIDWKYLTMSLSYLIPYWLGIQLASVGETKLVASILTCASMLLTMSCFVLGRNSGEKNKKIVQVLRDVFLCRFNQYCN